MKSQGNLVPQAEELQPSGRRIELDNVPSNALGSSIVTGNPSLQFKLRQFLLSEALDLTADAD